MPAARLYRRPRRHDPAWPAAKAGERAPLGEVRHYDCGHFDVYTGDDFERVVADQVAFLERHLAG